MRYLRRISVIAPLGVALALGVWLASDRSQNVEPALERTPSDVAAPVVAAPDDGAALGMSRKST